MATLLPSTLLVPRQAPAFGVMLLLSPGDVSRLLDGAICLPNRLDWGGWVLGKDLRGWEGYLVEIMGFGVRNAPLHRVCGAHRTAGPSSKG